MTSIGKGIIETFNRASFSARSGPIGKDALRGYDGSVIVPQKSSETTHLSLCMGLDILHFCMDQSNAGIPWIFPVAAVRHRLGLRRRRMKAPLLHVGSYSKVSESGASGGGGGEGGLGGGLGRGGGRGGGDGLLMIGGPFLW